MPAYARRPVPSSVVPQKFQDLGTANYDLHTNGNNLVMIPNQLFQGSSISQFEGNRWYWTGVQIRGVVSILPTTAGPSTLSSLCIVYDKAPRGLLPAVADIFDSDAAESFQRATTRDRFELLWRQDYVLEAGTAEIGSGIVVQPTGKSTALVDVHLRFRRVAVTNQSPFDITSAVTGALYFVGLGQGAINTNTIARLGFRIQYVDDE